MQTQPTNLIALAGVVFFAAVQCGYSTDMLTTITADRDTGTETQSESREEDSDTIPSPDESTDTEPAADTDSDGLADTESETETLDKEDSDSDSTVCNHGEIQPSEVLLIGDSWISLPGPQVGELARAAGIMKFDEDFVYRAVAGATIEDIVQQYDRYLAFSGTQVKVVIMNGGAVDTYPTMGSDESISHVVETFSSYLDQLAGEGSVAHVIYVLYSEGSSIPGVAALRPPMQAACAESVVPCHFIDLQPLWEGHPEYTSMDTINPSSVGSDVIAAAIWQEMQDNCIAQ
jgi:hypothetical protein